METDGNGYTFTNGNGDILTEHSPDYALGYEPSPQAGQTFTLTPIDRLFYKIMTEDGSKAFDLEGEHHTASTTVGLWEYGSAPTAVNGSLCANRTAEARMPFRASLFPTIHPNHFSVSLANRETYSGQTNFRIPLAGSASMPLQEAAFTRPYFRTRPYGFRSIRASTSSVA